MHGGHIHPLPQARQAGGQLPFTIIISVRSYMTYPPATTDRQARQVGLEISTTTYYHRQAGRSRHYPLPQAGRQVSPLPTTTGRQAGRSRHYPLPQAGRQVGLDISTTTHYNRQAGRWALIYPPLPTTTGRQAGGP